MSTPPIPRYVDLRKLAASGGSIAGDVQMGDLERLASECVHCDNPVKVELECGIDEEGYRTVQGTVKAVMPLQCQRCLGVVDIEAAASPVLAMVWSEEQIPDLPKRFDGIVVDAEPSDLYALIEDELLLCLPLAPRHAEGQCSALSERFGDLPEEDKGRGNPFEVLASLKKSEN